MKSQLLNNELIIYIEKTLYNVETLYKCFYWYGEMYDVDISEENLSYKIRIMTKNKEEQLREIPSLLSKIKRDLIDFKLRDIVSKETKTIRELIVAKAFAYYDLNENPQTEISDPIGFNPEDET